MAWLGEGFSSLKGQITNFAKGVLSEEGETDSGEARRRPAESTSEPEASGSTQSWDQVLHSADKFLGQDAPGEGLHPWAGDPSLPQSKDEKTVVDKDSLEKDVVSRIPRGIVNFFQLNPNEQGGEVPQKTGLSPTPPVSSNVGTQTDVDSGSNGKEVELRALEEANQRLIQQNGTLSANVNTLNRMVQDLESQIALSQDENANLSTGLEELDIQHQQAIEQILVVKDETQKQYEVLKLEFKQLKDSYEEIKMSKEKNDQEKHLPSLPEEDTDKEMGQSSNRRGHELMEELKERDEELQVLEAENASLRTTVKELTVQIDKFNENLPPILENCEEVEILEQKLVSLESEVTILREVRSNLETELNISKNKIDELLRSVQMSEAMLKNQDNLQAEIENLNSRNLKYQGEVEQLNIQNNNMKTNYEKHIQTMQTHVDSELAKKQSLINNLKEDLKEKGEMLDLKDHDCEQYGREVANLNKKLSQLENQLKQFDVVQTECETKDRKMCEILLESTAIEEEYKMYKENAERKYASLSKEFSDFKQQMSKEISNDNFKPQRLNPDGGDSESDDICLNFELKNEVVEHEVLLQSEGQTHLKGKEEDVSEKQTRLENELKKALLDGDLLRKALEDQIQQKEALISECKMKEKEIEKLTSEEPEVVLDFQNKIHMLEKELEGLRNISQEFEISKDISRQKEIEFKNQLQSKEEELCRYKNALRENEHFKERYLKLESDLTAKLTEKSNQIIKLKQIGEQFEKSVETCNFTIQNLKKQLDEKDQEIHVINKEINELSTKVMKYDEENMKIKNENASLILEKEERLAERLKTDSKLVIENDDLREEIKSKHIISEDMKKKIQEVNSKNEILQNNLTLLEQTIQNGKEKYDLLFREKEKLEQESILEISEMKSHFSQLETKHFELTKYLQVKEAEYSKSQGENQRINALLQNELEKSEKILIEKIEFNNKYAELENQYEEKILYIEQLETSHDKKVKVLKQEIESLKNQLEYASQLLRVVDRQEAEGQPSAESSSQKSCPDGCDRTHEELSRLSGALMNEQTQNKILISQFEEISEKYTKAEAQLVTLKKHLVEVEENYSGELMTARDKVNELYARLAQADERVRSSSNAYTSASIRANQQVESLTLQVKVLTEQNDKLEAENSKAEDTAHRQAAAITNLQAVLHQFQRDKQKDIDFETERIKQKLAEACMNSDQLNGEIKQLQEQLSEAKKGLAAATRLTEQLDKKTETIAVLVNRVLELEGKITLEEEKLKAAYTTVEGKVDRCLVKNLLVGYVCAPPKNKDQVLRVIGTVLDLNKEERQKVGLEAGLTPQQQSLSEAFIRFLETESQPKPQILLPLAQSESAGPSRKTSQSGATSLLLTDDLPNLPHFTVGRNPGSILKDVLKDRNS